MAGDFTALLVRITGRVQGVGYRDWTQREATGLGLTGWVRNEADGGVSAMIIGPDAAVTAMVERFRRGPRFASVTSVKTEATTVTDVPTDFRVTR